jgi:probable HAF family extracellular repeat protein
MPNGKIVPLPSLAGATITLAYGINNKGQIVGYSGNSPGVATAVMWTPKGQIVPLPSLAGATLTVAIGINNLGFIVGFSGDLSLGVATAVMWTPDLQIHALPSLPGATGSTARDINDQGLIVGSSGDFPVPGGSDYERKAVIWLVPLPNTYIYTLDSLAGAKISEANSVNNKYNEIVGYSGDKAVIWRGTTAVELPSLPGAASTSASDINDNGLIVGTSKASTGLISTPVLWIRVYK